jgi:4-hydroxy-3-polyprenylbenzoate decarboxylase
MAFFVGIGGASGVCIGKLVVESLAKQGNRVHLCHTEEAFFIAETEGVDLSNWPETVAVHGLKDWSAPVASGSYRLQGAVIAPCSMGMLGRISNGISGNLIERAADVALKEGWPLVLVPRETPLSAVHLENMLRLKRAGAVILPPMLTFYHRPEKIEEMVNFVAGRVLDSLGVEHTLYERWGE